MQAVNVEPVVDEADGEEEEEDDGEGLVHVESHLHDAVVDVGLVGFEHASAADFPLEGDADDVDAGQENEGEGDEQGGFAIGESAALVGHLVLDGEVGDDVAEEEAA